MDHTLCNVQINYNHIISKTAWHEYEHKFCYVYVHTNKLVQTTTEAPLPLFTVIIAHPIQQASYNHEQWLTFTSCCFSSCSLALSRTSSSWQAFSFICLLFSSSDLSCSSLIFSCSNWWSFTASFSPVTKTHYKHIRWHAGLYHSPSKHGSIQHLVLGSRQMCQVTDNAVTSLSTLSNNSACKSV